MLLALAVAHGVVRDMDGRDGRGELLLLEGVDVGMAGRAAPRRIVPGGGSKWFLLLDFHEPLYVRGLPAFVGGECGNNERIGEGLSGRREHRPVIGSRHHRFLGSLVVPGLNPWASNAGAMDGEAQVEK